MKYFLWIDGKQDGPFDIKTIRELIEDGRVIDVTLTLPEDGGGEWQPLSKYYGIIDPPKLPEPPPAPTPAPPAPKPIPEFALPPIEDSVVASALTIIAALELIGSPIAGLLIGADNHGNENEGWLVFLCGIISGLILLGFARVIQNTSESSQRLRRLEMLMQRSYDDK